MTDIKRRGVNKIVKLAKKFKKGNKVTVEFAPKKLKAHLKGADRCKAKHCAIIGEDELKNGTIWVKDLEEKEEKVLKIEDFLKL